MSYAAKVKVIELTERVAELEAENARLREVTCAAGPLFDEIRQLAYAPDLPDGFPVKINTTAGTFNAIHDALRGSPC